MAKMILILILGLAIGGTAGYFGGSTLMQKQAEDTLNAKKEEWNKELNSCKTEKESLQTEFKSLETQLKAAEIDLKLNEERACFVSAANLTAPEFSPDDLSSLDVNPKGDVLVKWNPVKGAKKYLVKIEDEAGTVVH